MTGSEDNVIMHLADGVGETVILGSFTFDDDVVILDSAEPEFDMKISASKPAVKTAPTFAKPILRRSSGQALRRLGLAREGELRRCCREFIRQAQESRE